MKRRRLLSLGLVLAMSTSILIGNFSTATAEGASSDFYNQLVNHYTAPDIENRTEVRWWMAEGAHTDETLEEEVQAIYDAGFRGIELCQLDNGNINAGDYGYGSDQWNHDFHLVMNKALDLGMTLGLTSGTNWNTTNVPGLDPDSQAANQCVFQLNEQLTAGTSRTGAIPTNGDLREKATFIGAYAYKKTGNNPITQDYRVIQTRENSSNPNTFTIETDVILDKQNTGLCFGAKDKNNFLMWQINTLDGGNGKVLLRPHVCKNGQWVDTKNLDITKAIGYNASEIFGKKIHMKIEVKDGKTIDTYFNGSDTSAVTYNIPTDKTGDFTLGKLMFRHNIKYANGTEELGRYDNIIVKDAAGTVIFEEDFEDPSDTGFDGGEVVDGMFQAGLKQVEGEVNSAIELDSSNIIDVTDQVVLNEDNRTGTLDWTAPDNGDYILMYYWQQGTAQESKPATKPSYCINYFDQEGVNATKEYWMEHVLNDPALNEKIKQGDVQLFMDSLEYTTGKGFANWSDDFAEEFKARKGYDITPYLILGVGLPQPKGIDWHPEVFGTYNLDDANLGQRILNDFHDVQTELYMENLLIPLRDWLHEYGIKLRAQISYGKYLEISEPSMAVDYPETERYNQANQLDMYRLWSGGAHLENKILSSETGAHNNYSYVYDYQTLMQEAYVQFAAGVSRMNWHVWTSQWAPKSVGVNWPGFQSMSSLYSFGLREPGYSEYKEFNDHMGRVQQLLREGKSRTDIGMVHMKYGELILAPSVSGKQKHQNWLLRHEVMPGYFQSTELQDHGYTYDYFSPEFFNSEDVYFDTETQTLELAGYKALVLYENWLTLDGAQAILNYAKQGLKVVIQDNAAVQTPYNDGNDEQLKAIIEELKILPTVKSVASADDVYEALQELGVNPYSEFAEENYQLLTQVRQDGDNMYLYAYNYCNDKYCGENHTTGMGHGLNAQTEIKMDGTFIPYYIDAWSGEVTEVSNYRYEDGKTVFPISLDYGDVALYAFEPVE